MANVTKNQQHTNYASIKALRETVSEPVKSLQQDLHSLRQQFFALSELLNQKQSNFDVKTEVIQPQIQPEIVEVVEKPSVEAEKPVVEQQKPVKKPEHQHVEKPKKPTAAQVEQPVIDKQTVAVSPSQTPAPAPAQKVAAEPKPTHTPAAKPAQTKVVSTYDENGREVKTYTDEKGNVRIRKFLDLTEKKPQPPKPQQSYGSQQGRNQNQGKYDPSKRTGNTADKSGAPKRNFGQQQGGNSTQRPFAPSKQASFAPPIPRPQDQKSFGNKNKTHDRSDDKHQNKKSLVTRNYSGADYDDDRVVRRAKKKSDKSKESVSAIKITHAFISSSDVPIKLLSEKIGVSASEIIKKLFKENIFKTINDTVDFDFAAYIAEMYGVTLELKEEKTAEELLIEVSETDSLENNTKRPPIVTVMGHVDHGKTSLLDAIRQTNVTSGEAGGITQHIGAYTVKVNDEIITFIDTPGHAAFTSMRARGAKITDVAIIVVAADDGVMPQTIEAINHAKAANVSIIVAINKMDKPDINVDRIKQQLSELELVPEEWGGDTMMVPISAKTRMGLDKLLEAILIVTELKELLANPDKRATGTVVEAKLDKGRGAVATILVSNGTLSVGDNVIAGLATGKIRALFDDKGNQVKSAGPSMPVEVLGFSEVPQAGDYMFVADEKLVRKAVEERKNKIKVENTKAVPQMNLGDLFGKITEGQLKTLNLIVKTDVQGSLEALKSSLEKISNDEVKVRPIHGGVGAINESDIMLARASDAIVIGFNVRADANAKATAEKEGVDVRLYNIIYDVVDDITAAMKGMLSKKYKETPLGTIEVREVFKITGVGTVAGCYVTNGKVTRNAKVKVYRNDVCVYDGEIDALKRFKDDVKEVASGYECGISVVNYNDIKVGDIFEAYLVEEIQQ